MPADGPLAAIDLLDQATERNTANPGRRRPRGRCPGGVTTVWRLDFHLDRQRKIVIAPYQQHRGDGALDRGVALKLGLGVHDEPGFGDEPDVTIDRPDNPFDPNLHIRAIDNIGPAADFGGRAAGNRIEPKYHVACDPGDVKCVHDHVTLFQAAERPDSFAIQPQFGVVCGYQF